MTRSWPLRLELSCAHLPGAVTFAVLVAQHEIIAKFDIASSNIQEVLNTAEAEPKAIDGLSEEVLQLDRRFGLELGEGARLRILVGPPAHEADPVTEAPVFESIEGHLADQLRAQGLPGQVAVLRPATRPTRCAAPFKTGPAAERLQH